MGDKAKGLEATKRNILTLLASLFDPLGIVSRVTVSMKILFQEFCNQKLNWDENLKGEIKSNWDRWVQDLLVTNGIRVNRCLYDLVGLEDVTECYLEYMGLEMPAKGLIVLLFTLCIVLPMAKRMYD